MQKDQLTLEDLSAATGMTARNVRAYQTKGLIPPPTRQGRRSVYSVEHVRRLQAIEHARARGASLSLIATHLAEGRQLDEDTLISWKQEAALPGPLPAGHLPLVPRAEIGPLLAKLDQQRDPSAQAHVEALIASGVFQLEGRRLYTARDLAAALMALQRQGLPVEMALGVAQRAMAAAAPVADTVLRALAELDVAAETMSGHLADVAGCVVRHVVAQRTAR